MKFHNNFKIGSLSLLNNIIYAPLAEYTDFAYRKFIRHFHKGLIFSEMIKMEALLRKKSLHLLKFTENMKPIGAQIYGSNPNIAKDSAKIIEDLGFDLIDLNCGCPSPNVIKDGSGAALLKNPSLIFKILCSMKSSVNIPLTVKIRLGWDENSICAKEIVKIASHAGCSAVTIHARTKKQGYSGKANWSYIKECKTLYPDMIIIGNGDLYSPLDVIKIFKETNCDAVMLARGMLQNPNIANEIEEYFKNDKFIKTTFDKKNAILKYVEYCTQEKGEQRAILDLKKMCCWLLKGEKNIKNLRIDISSTRSILKAIQFINDFDWADSK